MLTQGWILAAYTQLLYHVVFCVKDGKPSLPDEDLREATIVPAFGLCLHLRAHG